MTPITKRISAIAAVILLSLSLGGTGYATKTGTDPSILEKFKTSISKLVESVKTKGPAYVCGKGDFFSGKVTLRSFKGALANVEEIGKASTLLCNKTNLSAEDYKSFFDSSFYKIAYPYLKGKTQKQITDELVEQLKQRGTLLIPLVKGYCPKLPAFAQDKLKSVCQAP